MCFFNLNSQKAEKLDCVRTQRSLTVRAGVLIFVTRFMGHGLYIHANISYLRPGCWRHGRLACGGSCKRISWQRAGGGISEERARRQQVVISA